MKKCVSLILSCLMVFSMLSCVNATTLDETTDAGETKVEYSVGETYTVVIPEEIVVAKDSETPIEYSVVVKDLLIPYGSSLDVSVEYEGKLKLFEHSATTLGYQIIKNSDSSALSNGDKIISVPAGTVEEQSENITALLTEVPVIAGNYEDIATFKINVDGGKSQYGEAIQMWEISETQGVDDVWMTYYQPDMETVPAAYDLRSGSGTTTQLYENGTIYITGEGRMEEGIYNYLYSIEGVVQQLTERFEGQTGYNCRAEYNETTDDFIVAMRSLMIYIDDENAGGQNGNSWEPYAYVDEFYVDQTDERVFRFRPSAIIIDEGVTNVSKNAFFSLNLEIENVKLPSTLTEIGDYAFFHSSVVPSIIPEGVVTIGRSAFEGCTLTSITIPNSVTTIGANAFFECVNLTSVTLGNGVTSIGNHAFADCIKLEEVVLGDNITSIGYGVFMTAISLKELIIPENVESIDNYAFSDSSLSTVKGVAGSYAETFANNNGYTFVAI